MCVRYDGRYNLIKRVRTVVRLLPTMKEGRKNKTFLPVVKTDPLKADTPARKRKSPVPKIAPASSSSTVTFDPHPIFDPEALYLGYISPSRRMCQALPPDPPTPLDQPTPLVRPTAQTQIHYSSAVPLVQNFQNTPPPSPSCRHQPLTLTPTPPRSPRSPTSPAPSEIPPTPHASQTSYPSQTSYSSQRSYNPTSHDYTHDYETVMHAVGDVNRLSRFLLRGGASVPSQSHDGVPVTREDVIEVLVRLRDTMNTMFRRFPERFQ